MSEAIWMGLVKRGAVLTLMSGRHAVGATGTGPGGRWFWAEQGAMDQHQVHALPEGAQFDAVSANMVNVRDADGETVATLELMDSEEREEYRRDRWEQWLQSPDGDRWLGFFNDVMEGY
jgi:hypothetical protein